MMSLLRRYRVLTYYVLVFAISWGGMLIVVGPSGIFSSQANPAVLTQFIYLAALAGPSVAGILMTSLVTALGVLPLAIGMMEPGREVEGPMAVVILGGLLTSMALNLLVLPTLALRYGKFEAKVRVPETLSV